MFDGIASSKRCFKSQFPFLSAFIESWGRFLCSFTRPYKGQIPISPWPQMMYVPECVWLLLLISGTCFRYWTLPAINLKMTDMNPLIILIGPFLVYKNWDLILPGAQRSEHLGSCRRMWHLIHCVLIYELVTSFIIKEERALGQEGKGCLWGFSVFAVATGSLSY